MGQWPWILLGAAVAVLIYLLQKATLQLINARQGRDQRPVVYLGVLLRWGTAAAAMALAFHSSAQAGLTVFAALMVVRWMLLLLGLRRGQQPG